MRAAHPSPHQISLPTYHPLLALRKMEWVTAEPIAMRLSIRFSLPPAPETPVRAGPGEKQPARRPFWPSHAPCRGGLAGDKVKPPLEGGVFGVSSGTKTSIRERAR